ncbi:E3 ubiquitin-protein ligase MARCH2-like [Camponotus floridanus]|uniref:E3 ubiquitin-protein ligase MARCH2-like n=1 Tax=Camponotus floridanus TaxID=104421 RepID=UPI00059BFBD2|nr:E3 ubiquitin-protein ligase MARCH2-like [Camponotus floridanus]
MEFKEEPTVKIEMETLNIENENLNSAALSDDSLRIAKCWRCHEGISIDKGKLIRLCLCSDVLQFVHVKCLEKSVNVRSIYHCRICDVSLPLRRENKPPIKWCTNTTTSNMLKCCCVSSFKMLILILLKIGLIIIIKYLIEYLIVAKIGKFIPVLIIVILLFGLLLLPLANEYRIMRKCIISMRESCQRWYDSNQEMKLESISYQRLIAGEETV